MSKIYNFKDSMLIYADYSEPKLHKHLASHIIISLGGKIKWSIENYEISCRGICINSDVTHTGEIPEEGVLIFLFINTSEYAQELNAKYLNEKKFNVINDEVIDKICEKYNVIKDEINSSYDLLELLCLDKNNTYTTYDKRIYEILEYIQNKDTIEHTIIDDLSKYIFLSKSRMSHLFKDETGMTLHSYIALEKMRKAHKYIKSGMSITEASMKAGFDSPSHCAATCRRMFGLSLREVYKTIK